MIARLDTTALLVAATLALAGAAGCKKDEGAADKPADPAAEQPAAEDPAAEQPAAEDPAAAKDTADAPAAGADADADFILAEVAHEPTKEGDPVQVKFEKFKVVKADFDPKTIEGGTAEIEIDLASLSSGVEKRDNHLRSADYFDVAKMGTARVVVKDVKKGADPDTFTATAEVDLHGVKKSMPVTFQVVERTDDGIRVKAEQQLTRKDFKIGKAKGDPTSDSVLLKLQLTLNR